ncbi:hypothetical protein L596_014639 [Steinernema carpocapsae]|uniref:Uncharacterized protein n=1 Tax=Steinernema carpocapsae TaxID=34508 RepID=A0A4U5NDC2_STECR|nr:hypothetical protein L596_014639 [Steinernema carpocapsae]
MEESSDLIPELLDDHVDSVLISANISRAILRPVTRRDSSEFVPVEPASVFDSPEIYIGISIFIIAMACVLIMITRWHANRKPERNRQISSCEQVSTYL